MTAVQIAKAFADDTRFRLLMSLQNGELCVCQLVAFVNLATATVSKHLLVLRNAGLVESRKEGRWMYYRIAQKLAPTTKTALQWATESWNRSPEAKSDARHLKKVLAIDPEKLCETRRKKCC